MTYRLIEQLPVLSDAVRIAIEHDAVAVLTWLEVSTVYHSWERKPLGAK